MNRLLSTVLVALCSVAIAADAYAATSLSTRLEHARARHSKRAPSLASVCPRKITLRNGQALIKSQISDHISSGDARAGGYTFICGSLCASFPANIYYSDGRLAAKVGYYGTYAVNHRPRAYCAAGGAPRCSVTSIYRTARSKRTGSSVYLKINRTTCIKFNGAPGARNGGV